MNTVTTVQDQIEEVLYRVTSDGDGTVFHEDVEDVMAILGVGPMLYDRVSQTLEEIVYNRGAAQDFVDDPQAAAWKYTDRGRVNIDMLDSIIEAYQLEAERGIKLLVGLRALAG